MSDNSFASINFSDPQSKSIFQDHKEKMCQEYKNINYSGFVEGFEITKLKNELESAFVVMGNVKNNMFNVNKQPIYLKYSAPNPPTYSSNFSGSGLPYPNEEIAFQNTPNRGVVPIVNGSFKFDLKYPSSYYINLGTVYIEPHVKVLIVDSNNNPLSNVETLNLGNGLPFRTLSWPTSRDWNKGALFYKNDNLPVRSQYKILLDSAYPSKNVMPENFWGLKPSC
jgi:hypothetical protein